MSGQKHLILIHGRSTKPSKKEKERVATAALLHGLKRIDESVADRFREDAENRIKYSFVYYGDISNELILKKNRNKIKRLTGTDVECGDKPCEPDGYYDGGLDLVFKQVGHTDADYSAFLKKHKDRRWVDELASVVSLIGGIGKFSDEIISWATADMGAYLLTRTTGSAVRERLQEPLKNALTDGDDICLMSHSMGCMVSYDVLWKFSRMSEYRKVRENNNKVSKWITLGNPLGEPGVQQNLYDADEGEDGKYPSNIVRDWVNLAAADDFISHDSTVADDYAKMLERGHIKTITDKTIYNFWLGEKSTNPHKLYGYLDNPDTAREIVEWVKR